MNKILNPFRLVSQFLLPISSKYNISKKTDFQPLLFAINLTIHYDEITKLSVRNGMRLMMELNPIVVLNAKPILNHALINAKIK